MILDSNVLKSEYRLGRVVARVVGPDGKVRKVSVAYKNYRVNESVYVYSGAPDTVVERAVQRLVLLVPVDGE